MRPGQELDKLISTQVLGYSIHQQKRAFYEATPRGTRPLRSYSKEMNDAWEVVEAMGITIIPIENGQWFALVGPNAGWKSPGQFLEFVQKGNFVEAGAAVAESAPLSICLAALSAVAKKVEVASFENIDLETENARSLN